MMNAGSYQSSTATLKDVDEEKDGLDHGFNGGDLRLTMSRR